MESHYGNRDGFEQAMFTADGFETDYNDKELDGGWWVKSLHVPSDIVDEVIIGF